MKKFLILLCMVVTSTVLFGQRTYILPDVSANMRIQDNTSLYPAGIIVYVDIETPDGNYLGWADDNNPYEVLTNNFSYTGLFYSTNTGSNYVWNPIPLPANYYLLNFHCEKRDLSNTLISRTNVYCYGHLDSNNDIIANTSINLELN